MQLQRTEMNGVLKPFIITYAIIVLPLRFCICDAIGRGNQTFSILQSHGIEQ